MCGVIAFKGIFTPENYELIVNLMLQSQIRGKHATGVSYICGSYIKTIAEPIPAHKFIAVHKQEMLEELKTEGHISFIGHTRYCTSGIEYNQPIINYDLAMAMNGVITQSDPSLWPNQYGFTPKTTNDAEILHHLIDTGRKPLTELGTASMAVVGLHRSGCIFAFRNGRRPAWLAFTPKRDGVLIGSTEEILRRAGLIPQESLLSGTSYLLANSSEGLSITITEQTDLGQDLQFEVF